MEKKSRQQIFKEVKERISNNDYAEIHKLRSVKNVDRIIILGDKRLTESEIFDYYERVIEIQSTETLKFKAIGKLVDENLYNSLSESDRQRYILNLSAFYLSLKNEYANKMNKSI